MNTVVIDGLSFAIPLFIIAIGGIYSERSGVTNLALEGLLGVGAFTGSVAFLIFNKAGLVDNPAAALIVTFIFAFLGGGIFAVLHGLLCIKFKANQVISGVVINILAMALTTFLTSQINAIVVGKPSNKFILNVCSKFTVPVISKIPLIGAVFTDVYVFMPLIVFIAVFAWYLLYKTRFGLRLRACGDNPHAVDAAGADVAKIRFTAVILSGALSGIGGMAFAYSITASYSPGIYSGYGYLAIAALIFGNWKIMPTLGACMLFGFARSGGYKIAQILGFSSAFSDVIMTLPYLLTLILLMFFSSNNKAPLALGEIYDKGKR